MTVKLLTEHHLEFQSLKGGCTGSSESTQSWQNATLLEISCHGSIVFHLQSACVDNSEHQPVVDCQELSAPVPPHLQHNKTIYRSEDGVLVTTKDEIGRGMDSLDMVSVAVKIRLQTMASTCDLTTDEKVKVRYLKLNDKRKFS